MYRNLILVLVFASLCFVVACSDGSDTIVIDNTDDSPTKITFDVATGALEEGNPALTVNIKFSRVLENNLDLIVKYESTNGVLGEDFDVLPKPVGDEIKLTVDKGSNEISFQVTSISDGDEDEESIIFSLENLGDESFEKGENASFRLRIFDKEEEPPVVDDCSPGKDATTFEVVTWNIERFPMAGNTVSKVIEIIENMEVDIIAVQEIIDEDVFLSIANNLEGWGAEYFNVNGGIELGFFYKISEISSFGEMEALFPNQSSPFPREPVSVEVTHVNGLTIKLVNLHLKCCNDGVTRRRNASEIMKTYFDENEASSNLVVVGDYNDDINNGSPFQNFVTDSENYLFADAEIQSGSNLEWSYPSFPSHLDHILISNELFDNLVSTKTLKLETCDSRYSRDVSDHRPVMVVFKAD